MPTDDQLRQRFGDGAYFGRSRRARVRRPSLRGAVKDAYRNAAADGGAGTEEKTYRVVEILAVGTNPLSEYIVVLARD